MKILNYCTFFASLTPFATTRTIAHTQLITSLYSTDPSARVFDDKVYVYPSHDIIATPGHGRAGWFCMQDYHVFSSPNLTDWTDHNMLELASEPKVIDNLPAKGLKEGPYLFERKGVYYLTYPHVANKIQRLEYMTGNSPMGPFRDGGVLMDESSSGCWTNHQSIIEFKNQWFLFYHNDDLSPNFDKARSIRADSLFFNEDDTIRKAPPHS
jgi:hypothetical protein